MHHHAAIIDLVERTERAGPTCACGRPMIAAAHGSELWLECLALRDPRPRRLGRLATRLGGHERRLLLEDLGAAAA